MGAAIEVTRAQAIEWARSSIDRLDARLLLQFVTSCHANALITDPKVLVNETDWASYQTLVARRVAGEPLAYLIGQAGFYGDLLIVTPDVLVPRPETEDLVDWALEVLLECPQPVVIDLGTGSGAIALALAKERPDARIFAVDISPKALLVAQNNQQGLNRPNIEFVCANWYSGLVLSEKADLIISNPPYIPACDPHLKGDGVCFEPRLALTDEADGLDAYRQIALGATRYLKPQGWLLVEHGHDQSAAVAAILEQHGLVDVVGRNDLSKNPRMTGGQSPLEVA